MQINTSSSQEVSRSDRGESICTFRCPVCSGSLVPLHNFYRCSRCSYHICAGCEQTGPESTSDD
jgi:hypothetical protein